MKKVAVVILNFKVRDQALKCLESVRKSSYKNLEIIVVDNNSGDDIEKDLEDVIFLQTGENKGYAGGNNFGIKKALGLGVDYILILNPDTVIETNAIEKLVEAAEKYNAGIVGPKIYFKTGKTIWYAGGIFDKANVLGSHRGVNEKDTGQFEKIEETDFVSGATMMIRRDVFEKVGLFDERYFLYYEDQDLCLRAKLAGFRILYVPQAEVFHENAGSTKLGSPLQDYFITRNRMLLASKYLPFRTRFALKREAIRNFKIPARRKALKDFLTGNFGKGSFKIK
jgi:GT2 family glycosyltransferase